MLAWLVCHPEHPQPRDRLVGLFWADRSAANAKASLRQALAGLRRVLPEDALLTRGDALTLNLDVVSSDVGDFKTIHVDMSRQELARSLAIYDGDLLSDFNARSQAFDDWLLVERENLRQQALTGLTQLLEIETAERARDPAILTCQRLLTLDPLHEDVHRQLMQLYADNGQLGLARRQFKLCRDALSRELNLPPAHETMALFNALGSDSNQTSSTEQEAPSKPAAKADSTTHLTPDRRATLPSIAVLPFRNMSTDPDHEYVADGMSEELINLLANSANWQVCARNVSFQYRDKGVDARHIGEQLGVSYLVDGSVRSMGDRLRTSASLIASTDGLQIWSEHYDRPMAEIFDVQDAVVHAIFRTLKNRLGFAERERVRRTPTTSLDAWGLLMKSMQVNVVDTRSHNQRLALIEEALRVEPDYPRAHAYMASQLFTAVGRGMSRDRNADAQKAGEHTETALAYAPTDVVVLRMCAGGLAAIGQTKHALGLAERAYELNGAPDALLVAVLTWNGRLEEARAHCETIVANAPVNVPLPAGELRPLALLGNLCMLSGELDAALEYGLQDQRANPGNYFAHVNLANVHGLRGEDELANAAWALAIAIVPELTAKSL